jgi:O-antigen ligase
MQINIFNKYFYIGLASLLFLYLTVDVFPTSLFTVIVLAFGGFFLVADFNEVRSSYVVFLIFSLFTDAFNGRIIIKFFDEIEVAEKIATASNYLGIIILLHTILYSSKRNISFRWTKVDLALGLYVFICILTSFTGANYSNSFKQLNRIPSFIILYFITRLVIVERNDIQYLLGAFMAACIGIFLISADKFARNIYFEAAASEFVFLMVPLIYTISQDIKVKEVSRNNTLWMVVLLFGSFMLLISESRRILLALVFVWIISTFSNLKRINYTIIFLLIVGMFFFSSKLGELDKYKTSLEQINDFDNSGLDENSLSQFTSNRSDLWEIGYNIFLDNLIFGVGLDNHYDMMEANGAIGKLRVHNIVLDILVQLGVFGFISFLLVVFYTYKQIALAKKVLGNSSFFYRNYLTSLQLGLTSMLIIAFFGGSVLFNRWGWFEFAFLVGSSTLFIFEKKNVNPN